MMMADGYGRASGRVAVCTTHQGPGFTNALTGLVEAAKARTPAILLTADTPAGTLWSNFKVDQDGIAERAGAIVERVRGPGPRPRTRRAPCAARWPSSVRWCSACRSTCRRARAAGGRARAGVARGRTPAPDAAASPRVADLLAAAQRPLIVAGRGAVLAGARDALERLGARTGALLATSRAGARPLRGLPVRPRHRRRLRLAPARRALGEADVVLAAGAASTTGRRATARCSLPGARWCRSTSTRTRPAPIARDVGVVGDAAAAAAAPGSTARRRAALGLAHARARREIAAGAGATSRSRTRAPPSTSTRARSPSPSTPCCPRAHGGGRLGPLHGLAGDVPGRARRAGFVFANASRRSGWGWARRSGRRRAARAAQRRRARRRRRADGAQELETPSGCGCRS